jgi:signal transduction histidine kinase
MFLCYNIVTVDLHGEIHCNSAPGEGVHFTITLPCKRADMESST